MGQPHGTPARARGKKLLMTRPRRSEIASILDLGVPIALTQLAGMGFSMVDMAFVGRLGVEPLAGISIGNAIFNTLMIGSLGFLLGLDFLISHAIGAGKQDEANSMLIQALYVSTLLSIPLIAIMTWGSGWFEFFGIAPGVAQQGQTYLRALAWSLWPWLLFSSFRQYLQGMGVALPVLYILIVANVINALGNWLFVFGFDWNVTIAAIPLQLKVAPMGIAGSALATGISRAFMFAALAAYTIAKSRRGGLGLFTAPLKFSFEKMRRLIRLGAPASGQLILEVGVFATATLLAGRLGAAPLAAHQIVLQIASFTFMVPLGLSSATAVRVAQALGAGDRSLARRTGWLSIGLSAGFMAFCGVMLLLFSKSLLGIFTSDSEVIRIGTGLVIIAGFFQLFDGAQVVGSGVLRGIGNTRASFIANLLGHWFLGLPIGAMLCFWAGWGVHGLWLGLSAGLVFVAITLIQTWRTINAPSR